MLEARLGARFHHEVSAVERRDGLRSVRPQMTATALGSGERRVADEARNRVRIRGQPAEPVGFTDDTRPTPDRGPRLVIRKGR